MQTAQIAEPEGAFSVAEFCATYNISRAQTYIELGAGRLTARKRGAATLISRAEAARWYDDLPDFAEAKRAEHAALMVAARRSRRSK